MKEAKENIFTVFDELISREEKEAVLGQKAISIWMTGLSGSGKTTIAKALERMLHKDGHLSQLLDGDNIRVGISNNLSFSPEDRQENIRRIAEVTKLFVNCGVITINCFVSPTRDIRQMAKDIIGEENFIEVFVNTPLEVCESRDVKGLYAKARSGQIKDFTGIDAPFEAPETPDLDLRTENRSIEDTATELYTFIKKKIAN